MKFEYKVGDKAIVIREICGHQYPLGEIVTIINEAEHYGYFEVTDGKDQFYVSEKEIFPYEIVKRKILEDASNDRY